MNKKLAIAMIVVVVLIAALSIGATVVPDAHEEVVFYDESAVEVVGVEAVAPATWMLPSGEHTVVTNDGTNLTVLVSDGSWQYTQ